MRGYAFAENVSACRPADRLILLDLQRDRYFGLGEASERALSRLMAGTADADDLPALDCMTEHGLLVRAADGDTPLLCPSVPVATARRTGGGEASRWQIALAILAIRSARRDLRRCGFAAVIADLRRRRPRQSSSGGGRFDAMAAAFRGADGVMSTLDQCLPRSIALVRRLFSAGITADMIVGVAVQPFRAHCWVECEGRLLVDDVDTVRQFTPILLL